MQNTTIFQELRVIGTAGFLIILLTGGCLGFFFAPGHISPAQYWMSATGIWIFACWQTWTRADLNRAAENLPIFPNLGWANGLTLLRGGLIALTAGFLLQPTPTGIIAWLPGVFYGVAALLDRLDGFIARRSGRSSQLGRELDTVFDALGLLVAPLIAVQFGKLHPSFLAVSLAYYVFIFGIYCRQKLQRPVYPLLPSQLRRAFAGFQMGFVAAVMFPIFPSTATTLLGVAFMLPILMGFVIDWWIVSGRIDGNHIKTQVFFAELDASSKYLLQPALRIITAVLVLLLINTDETLSTANSTALIVLAILILVGAGARIAALSLLLLCSYLMNNHIEWYQPFILFIGSWLLLLGPGNYVLWRGDDTWINRQDGAQ